ncbi:hypothetical protein [Photobacterium pectinilyticum]|uniref:hypothetical protein n=1 Tax=Photobacterium pectinilyticum TaxID=2906793 RepID=UPI0020CFCE21|nr:hypothetical protein [Photobacterium sp. ZSDE20]
MIANATIQISPTLIVESVVKVTREPRHSLTEAMAKRIEDFALIHHPESHWCSSNWQGYTLQWRLEGNLLMLDTITYDWCSTNPAIYKAGMFFNPDPGTTLQNMLFTGENEPLFAEWVSGVFTLNAGEQIPDFHVPPLYSQIEELRFENGDLIETLIKPNPILE